MFLILGPVLNLIAGFFWEPDRQGVTAGTLVALSCACWLVGLIGLYDRLRNVAPRYVAVAMPVTVFATVGGVAFGVQSIHEGLFDASHATAVELLNAYPFAAYTLYWIGGPLFPLVLFGLGLMLARLRAAPLPVAVLLCLGAIAFPLSRITREASIAHLADLLLLLPFLYLGLRSRRGEVKAAASDREPVPVGPSSPPTGDSRG
ncbi:hypothetical protein I0C86_00805 [Plantactinospora sp. S1510]|uniref:Uncharacterized protein n=1 Tax=Plantactinospora alkalitolerans TaxID=2789879 RepID=A0ABS0GNP6_9ACTN|nr:hypothetical protein [Plantactinospora alkalitolerans]MBF9127542.1 hypothetical protein [Plantactinospora alkalitolerans]